MSAKIISFREAVTQRALLLYEQGLELRAIVQQKIEAGEPPDREIAQLETTVRELEATAPLVGQLERRNM